MAKLIRIVLATCLWGLSLGTYAQKRLKIYPLGSFTPDSAEMWLSAAFDDKINNDINIVGLGEFTHGGHQTFMYKCRMVQYLVTKKGFRNFLIEYPDMSLVPLNDYLNNNNILNTDSAATIAEKAFSWSIKDRVLYDLMRWIKEFNLNHPNDKVSVHGFDVVGKPTMFADYFLKNCLQPIDPVMAEKIKTLVSTGQTDSVAVAEINWFENHNDLVKQKLNSADYLKLLYSVKIASYQIRHAELEKINIYKSSAFRDSVMAANVAGLSADTKSIVWAHNLHINTMPGSISLGNYLRPMVGDKYFNILTDFSGTATVWYINNARQLSQKNVIAKKQASASVIKAKFGFDQGIVFFDEMKRNNIKAIYGNIDAAGQYYTLGGGKPFDVLVYFGHVTPCE